MKSWRSLLCIYYPHQILPGLVALIHYRKYFLHEDVAQPTLIYVHIFSQDAQAKELLQAISNIAAQIPWLKIEVAPLKYYGPISEYNIPVTWRARRLRAKKHQIREIFYAHDLSADFTPQILMQAFPQAKRICFGDSLGLVYSEEYFRQVIYGASIKNILKRLRRAWILPKNKFTADLAVLLLPCDPNQEILDKLPFAVPTRTEACAVLNYFQHLQCHDEYTENLLDTTPQAISFFALSNLNEAKLTTLAKELALYQEIINKHVPAKSLLIIKAHPGSSDATLQALQKHLQHAGGIHYFAKQYSVYPVELNQKILQKARQILSISYSSISIRYLYQQEVLHVLNDELIATYFNSDRQDWVKKGNQEYLSILQQLDGWDEKQPFTI